MPSLPPRAELDQLRRLAKERLRAARAGDAAAIRWITTDGRSPSVAAAQHRLARDHGFSSWAALHLEVTRRRALDAHDSTALSAFIARHPGSATEALTRWMDHPRGASPLSYLAMARYDTTSGRWRDVTGTADAARVLLAAGAPIEGVPEDRETPLITAASYGDAEVAAVLIAAGADIDAVAALDSGGVPGGSALRHAAVFGMTSVVDLLAAAGAQVRSIEEAAAVGDLGDRLTADTDLQHRLRALVMAADHQRLEVIERLVAAGTPVDEEDGKFGRHPLHVAVTNGRPDSVATLLRLGADAGRLDPQGRSPLELCRRARESAIDPADHAAVEALLSAAVGLR